MKTNAAWNIVFGFLIASICFLIASFVSEYKIVLTISQIACFCIATTVLCATVIIDNKARKNKELENAEKMKKIIDEYKKQQKDTNNE